MGPYYVSTGTLDKFAIYARSNFKTIDVSFNVGSTTYDIATGNRSAVVDFDPNEFSKTIHVSAKGMGWKAGSWVTKQLVNYTMIISRFDPSKTTA